MEQYDANIQVYHGKHIWTIPITLEVSFRQTFEKTLNHPEEYEVAGYEYLGLGYENECRQCNLVEKLVESELDQNGLFNVELL